VRGQAMRDATASLPMGSDRLGQHLNWIREKLPGNSTCIVFETVGGHTTVSVRVRMNVAEQPVPKHGAD
jgi:hypothetical protein